MLIKEFFENQEIFITGGSGFIGKALIEKILRSCPNIGKIYLLIRSKRDKSAEERVLDILKTSLFDRVRLEQPQALHKVCAIEGDCSRLHLNIKPEDLEKIQNVSIIFHSAASVRFDDSLRDAVLLNTRGTHELMKIAQTLQNLKVFTHISTTYCNALEKDTIEEKIYPAYADWRTTIKLAETYDTETLNVFNLKYGGNQPNTYTFTKSLAEQVINDYKDKLPVIIFRPSVVISSLNEPVVGWIDNFNGPMGLLVACAIGVMRTNYGDPDVISDIVPVDIVVRAMLIAAYKRGTETANLKSQQQQLEVINCANSLSIQVTLGTAIEIGKRSVRENPSESNLWVPDGGITRCRVWNFIRVITLHILMAVMVDSVLRMTNRKPFLLKLQRRINAANFALQYFLNRTWKFQNNNFIALENLIPPSETEIFSISALLNIKYEEFLRDCFTGMKIYLLHEPARCSKAAWIRFRILQVLNFVIKVAIGFYILRFLLSYINLKIMKI